MPFVRRHVTRRLKTAKADCDKELQRVTNSITTYFEEKLKENEQDREAERELRERERGYERDWERERGRYRDMVIGTPDSLHEAFLFQPAELRSALQSDTDGSDGGVWDVEGERRSRHSRQRRSFHYRIIARR
jgi:serine/threonine-protein kinase RIM15